MSSQEHIGYLIARTNQAIRNRIAEIAADYHITITQFGILTHLYHGEGLDAHGLVLRHFKDEATVMSILDRLEAKGLVRREPNPADRRSGKLYLTEYAESFLPELMARVEDSERLLAEALPPGAEAVLRNGLNRLYEIASGRTGP